MQNSNDLSVIGCIELKEIEKEAAADTVVIPSGITEHYFMLMPPDKMEHLSRKHLIGYVMVSADTYVAVYEHSILMPLLLSIAFLAVSVPLYFKSRGYPCFYDSSQSHLTFV